MKKTELKNKFLLGGSFTVDACHFKFSELVLCAKSAMKGGGILHIRNSGTLFPKEIDSLCEHAPGHVNFLDIKFED